jgi:hypothetical protein
MFWQQANLFVQFAVHGLFWAFTMLNPALRELPRMLSNAFSPENLVSAVKEDNADIGSIPFTVEHNRAPNPLKSVI